MLFKSTIERIQSVNKREPKPLLRKFMKLTEELGELSAEVLKNEPDSTVKEFNVDNLLGEMSDALIVYLAICDDLMKEHNISDKDFDYKLNEKISKWEANIKRYTKKDGDGVLNCTDSIFGLLHCEMLINVDIVKDGYYEVITELLRDFSYVSIMVKGHHDEAPILIGHINTVLLSSTPRRILMPIKTDINDKSKKYIDILSRVKVAYINDISIHNGAIIINVKEADTKPINIEMSILVAGASNYYPILENVFSAFSSVIAAVTDSFGGDYIVIGSLKRIFSDVTRSVGTHSDDVAVIELNVNGDNKECINTISMHGLVDMDRVDRDSGIVIFKMREHP